MGPSRLFLLATMLAGLAVPASAEELLQWKLSSGESLEYRLQSQTVTQSQVSGFESTSSMVQTMQMAWDVETKTANNSYVVGQTINRIRVEVSPNSKDTFTFDSGLNSVPDNNIVRSLGTAFRRLIDQKFVVTMAATGEVKDVVIPQELRKTLQTVAAANPAAINEEKLKEMMSQASVILPEIPIVEGHTWQNEQSVDLGFSVLEIRPQMTYKGLNDDGHAVIKYVPKVTLTANDRADIKMSLNDSRGTGTVVFDLDRGRVLQMELRLTMKMQTELNGRQTTQTTEMTTRMQLVE